MKRSITRKDIEAVAREVLERAGKEKNDTATVITLSGDLGSGKTTLTQEIGRLLGIKEHILSPTFVILKNYKVKSKNISWHWKRLIHIDAYRLNESFELVQLGWEKMLEDVNNLIILEWPERVPECITGDVCRVTLSHESDETRSVEFA
jgi:tRNA threonylcarbamoyladenosine biosynthesis protein TsaE